MHRQEQDMREIDIAAYLDDRLNGAAREAFELQLASDNEGKDVLAVAKGALQVSEDAAGVPERLMQKARELYPQEPDIFDLVVSLADRALLVISASPAAGVAAPAAAGAVRGPEAGTFPYVVLTKIFNRVRADVYIERMAGNTCAFTIKATDLAIGGPLKGVRAELASGYRELASSLLDQGTALFEDIPIGSYSLIMRKQDDIIGRMAVKITGA